MSKCTIYKNIYSKEPFYITVDEALNRIKTGKSQEKIEKIRTTLDKTSADALKRDLPSICFSGEFKEREDSKIISHSGYIILDFDQIDHLDVLAAEIIGKEYVKACWLSPRGNGLKALVSIASGAEHRKHFDALCEEFSVKPDKSGVNEARVCYESYDPNIIIKENVTPFKKTKVIEIVKETEILRNDILSFQKLLIWITNKGESFSSGSRNIFIFKLACSCSRFGILEGNALDLIINEFGTASDFTQKEIGQAVRSAYKTSEFGNAVFEKDILVDRVTRGEVKIAIPKEIIDDGLPVDDVVYGMSVKDDALSLYDNGYESVSGIFIPDIDHLFKAKKGEVTLLTGIGNYGKSAWWKWYSLMRAILYGEKFAAYAPEDNPPHEYYNDFVEMLLGTNCTPKNYDGTPNKYRPTREAYQNAYSFVCQHFFYMYPKKNSPTFTYVLSRFLEMCIKEKVSGCCIDPWNQVDHDYGNANVSKYLEGKLSALTRFAQENNISFTIVHHPHAMVKQANGNYPCPDVYDLNDGAMWNNKMDNIVVYHRPIAQTSPSDPSCEFHSKKIKRQKTVGKKGNYAFEFSMPKRRFIVNGIDYMANALEQNGLDFKTEVLNYQPKDPNNFFIPVAPAVDLPNMQVEPTRMPQLTLDRKLTTNDLIGFTDNKIELELPNF